MNQGVFQDALGPRIKSYVLTAAAPHHPGKIDIDATLTRLGAQVQAAIRTGHVARIKRCINNV